MILSFTVPSSLRKQPRTLRSFLSPIRSVCYTNNFILMTREIWARDQLTTPMHLESRRGFCLVNRYKYKIYFSIQFQRRPILGYFRSTEAPDLVIVHVGLIPTQTLVLLPGVNWRTRLNFLSPDPSHYFLFYDLRFIAQVANIVHYITLHTVKWKPRFIHSN